MNEDNGSKIFCSRCGAEMSSNARCCIKCGNLNYNHEANKNIRQYIDINENTYEIGSGNFINNSNNSSNGKAIISVGNNTGNRNFCFFVNFTLYIVSILLVALISGLNSNFTLDGFLKSAFPIFTIIVSIFELYIYSFQLILIKCNEKWWSVFVPIYNLMILGEITFKNKWLGLVALIPIIGQIFFLVMLYKLGTKFGKSGIMTALFSLIYLPIIGFGDSLYENHSYIDYDEGDKTLEIDYRRKKNFLTFIILFFVVGLGLFIYSSMNNVSGSGFSLGNYYYVYASNKISKKTQNAVLSGNISCDSDDYKKDDGIYYFNFSDFSDYVYLPFYGMREVISGYIKIDNTKGDSRYYITLTDGKYGMPETLIENVDTSKIKKFKATALIPEDANMCSITE